MKTHVQNVDAAWPKLKYARPSRPIRFPVSRQRVLLKEQEVVMGSAVLLAPGRALEWCTPGPPMPCVASLHHW